ncbi:hypothetical protein H7J93_26160 [Mycobacterium barrassiae]|uniref:hypothetical protein n=1 Tax=Mycobacterium barrassiae TaxID=319709 RepID=UPI002265D523|nr:hypothetical protein [Mycobacterium barrassiae]MCV7303113.1 hypothetical protein [Mycobacterium barrassiae]
MSAVDEYQAATEQLAASAAREVLAVYADLTAERIPPGTAALWIAAAINRANAAAVTLADVWLSVQIEEQAAQPVPTVGVLPVDGSERLVKAANTVLSSHFERAPKTTASYSRQNDISPDQGTETGKPANFRDATNVSGDANEKPTNSPDMRLERLARSEVFEAAQQATHDAMQKQLLVEGWVRQFDADPCQLCRWWWREGRIWPKAHPMPRHPGCNCTQRVVLVESVRSTGFTRQLERNT